MVRYRFRVIVCWFESDVQRPRWFSRTLNFNRHHDRTCLLPIALYLSTGTTLLSVVVRIQTLFFWLSDRSRLSGNRIHFRTWMSNSCWSRPFQVRKGFRFSRNLLGSNKSLLMSSMKFFLPQRHAGTPVCQSPVFLRKSLSRSSRSCSYQS